jgi:hypothetical protein
MLDSKTLLSRRQFIAVAGLAAGAMASACAWRIPNSAAQREPWIYGSLFVRRIEGMGIQQMLISPRSAWQSPYVERLVHLP